VSFFEVLPGVVKFFGKAAFCQELLFQLPQQLIEQVVGLVNQADKRIGRYLGPSRLARATPTSLSSVFLEVPEAWLPSAIFCLPLRAAWIIWSVVRDLGLINRSQNFIVAS